MAKNHETSVAKTFNDYLTDSATSRNRKVQAFSLDGQDAITGADYLISDHSRFALIEFKWEESDIASEAKKPRRHNLCKKLNDTPKMKRLHDQCHYVAWSHQNSPRAAARGVTLNVYRLEVCNQQVLGRGFSVSCAEPDRSQRIRAGLFVDVFLGNPPQRSIVLREFETYLYWLLVETSSSSASTLELVARDRDAKELALITFSSVRQAHDWMQTIK